MYVYLELKIYRQHIISIKNKHLFFYRHLFNIVSQAVNISVTFRHHDVAVTFRSLNINATKRSFSKHDDAMLAVSTHRKTYGANESTYHRSIHGAIKGNIEQVWWFIYIYICSVGRDATQRLNIYLAVVIFGVTPYFGIHDGEYIYRTIAINV